MNKAHKELLKKNYEDACNSYLKALADAWEWDVDSYGFWIADCVGETFSYGDNMFIDMQDIIFCVENDVKEGEYDEWQEYCLFAHEYNQTIPNFQSWHKGCPRLTAEEQKRLIDLKKDFEDTAKEYKNKTNPF